jgi:hypothetical protein
MTYFSHRQVLSVRTEIDTSGSLDLFLGCPRLAARRVGPVMESRRRERRRSVASIAERSRSSVAALVLGRGRRSAVDGRRGIDGVRSRPGAVKALRNLVSIVDGCNHSGRARRIRKTPRRGKTVKGIGRARSGPNDLAKRETDVGARRLDWGAQWRVSHGGRRRRVELDTRAKGRAHHPGVIRSKRHLFLQDSRGGQSRKLRDISTRHGKRAAEEECVDVGICSTRQLGKGRQALR